MFGRLRGGSKQKDGAATPAKDAQALLHKIESSLASAKKSNSFPQVNEARRLCGQLDNLVSTKLKGKDEQDLWRSQLVVVNSEIEAVMTSLMGGEEPAEPAAKVTEPEPAVTMGGGLFDGMQLGGGDGGLFAGLNMEASPAVAADPAPADAQPSPAPVLDALEGLSLAPEGPVTPETPVPEAEQNQAQASGGGGRRRKKNLRVGYARKEKASQPAAAPPPQQESTSDPGQRLPLSDEMFVSEAQPATEDAVGDPVAMVEEEVPEPVAAAEGASPEPVAADEQVEEADAEEEGEGDQVDPLAPQQEAEEDDAEGVAPETEQGSSPSSAGAVPLAAAAGPAEEEEPAFSLDFSDVSFDADDLAYETALERLEKILSANLIKLELQNSEVLSVEAKARRGRFEAAALIADRRREAASLEAEQQKAVEDEEYERADELESAIDDAKSKCELAVRDWYTAQQQCEDVAARFASIVEEKGAVRLRYSEALSALSTALEAKASAVDGSIEDLERENAEHEANVADTLEDDLSRLKALRRVLEEREAEVAQKIQGKTGGLVAEREEKVTRRAAVEAELEEIREQMRLKEEELAEVQGEVDEVDSKILKVEQKFQKQQDKLAAERREIEEDEAKFEEQREGLLSEQEVIRDRIEGERQRKQGLADASKMAAESSVKAKAQVEEEEAAARRTVELRSELSELRAEESEASLQTDSLRAKVESSALDLEGRREALRSSLARAEEARATISEAEERLPKLEQEKKAAVAKKNFKDAAKFSSEAKALEEGKREAEGTLEELEGTVVDCEARVAEAEREAEDLGSELEAAEKEGRKLQDRHLRITIDMVTRAMEAAAASENFDDAASLQNELEVAQELKRDIEASLAEEDAEA